jgi:hypothetical protein
MNIKRLHYFSGLFLVIFIGLHLVNHFFSIWGADKHIEMMQTLRHLYRNPVFEIPLLAAVCVQIISGIKLVRTNQKLIKTNFDRLQIWTGFYLALFLVIHVSAVMVGRFVLQLDTNFYFGVAGLNSFPFSLFFIPYYGLAILSIFGHVAAIHARKMKLTIWSFSPQFQSIFILVIGLLLTISIFYGLTNHFKGVVIPSEYDVLVGK